MDRVGAVIIDLREPPLNGVGRMSDLAERAAKIFENCRILAVHDIRFAEVEPGEEQDIDKGRWRSEEHTSELQSLMRISYAVFCLKKKKQTTSTQNKIRN